MGRSLFSWSRIFGEEEDLVADDLSRKAPADAVRLNVNEAHEIRYWCDKFGCTPTELRNAVRAVGVLSRNVDAELRKHRASRKKAKK